MAAALLALRRALRIAVDGGNPLARGQALAALLLAEWKAASSRPLSMRETRRSNCSGNSATTRWKARSRTAWPRSRGRSGASADARRLSQLAIDAGEAVGTRTTVALGHLDLARLDLDDGQIAGAGIHVDAALAVIDPEADRWVLVEAVEVVARLLSSVGRSGAVELLDLRLQFERTSASRPVDGRGRHRGDTRPDGPSGVHARTIEPLGGGRAPRRASHAARGVAPDGVVTCSCHRGRRATCARLRCRSPADT